MSDDQPHPPVFPVTREDFKALVKEAIREEFEIIGIDASDAGTRAEVRKDMEALRQLRVAWAGAAKKVGSVVLMMMLTGAGALIAFGLSMQAKGLK